jgi:hypothetical protein
MQRDTEAVLGPGSGEGLEDEQFKRGLRILSVVHV